MSHHAVFAAAAAAVLAGVYVLIRWIEWRYPVRQGRALSERDEVKALAEVLDHALTVRDSAEAIARDVMDAGWHKEHGRSVKKTRRAEGVGQ